jgi:hypothetical protein
LGRPIPALVASVTSTSSDARRALRFVERRDTPALGVSEDGQRLELASGSAIDLGRRAAPRRILVALVGARLARPGAVVPYDDLVAAGWPGERMGSEAARKRLRTAIWTLRKLGLERLLVTHEDGYLIAPVSRVYWLARVT